MKKPIRFGMLNLPDYPNIIQLQSDIRNLILYITDTKLQIPRS